MPKLRENQVPSYRLHKQSGQAVVTLNGRDFLLGKHGSAASKAEYRRLSAEWIATKGLPGHAGADLTVSELVLAFWKHAQAYYRRPDGSQTKEVGLFKLALRPLRQLYGPTRAADFGPRCLKAVIQHMIELKWCRASINKHAARIKHLFKWAVGNELVPPSVHHGLVAVTGLRQGRSEAIESEPVRPVPEATIDATLPHLALQVAAMVRLQLLTGMRPGEVCEMRGCDIDTTGPLWVYKPASHKTQHFGHERTIYLGPHAQKVVAPFLKTNLQAYLFSPRDVDAARRESMRTNRVTPFKYGNRPGTNRKPRPAIILGDRYAVTAYRRAILRGCEEAFAMPAELREPRTKNAMAIEAALPEQERERRRKERRATRASWHAEHCWHPHQLRHTAATRLRKEYGLEAAQVILGHKTLAVTEIYAEKNVAAAQRIMAEVG